MEKIELLKEWMTKEIELLEKTNEDSENKDKIIEAGKISSDVFSIYLDKIKEVENPDMVKELLLKLIVQQPLVPIDDNNDENDWDLLFGFDPALSNGDRRIESFYIYKNERYGSLYKRIHHKLDQQPKIEYTDVSRAYCFDINTKEIFYDPTALKILDELFPIVMPYYPAIDKIKIFAERFKTYSDNKDPDTLGIFYFRFSDGSVKEVKRFFKIDNDNIKEIDKTEYFARRKKAGLVEEDA